MKFSFASCWDDERGRKLESYKLLGRALSRLSTSKAWRLIVAGDGKCRQEIEKCFGSETLFCRRFERGSTI